ncbi:glycoside hydrolase family 27 protein [Echinimonas agarilytica]|uniref:Alpha-galactosidase n=1 Tax=Echinimonas agarilytica TaxID=1215918 RepID=A0AA42B6Q3_9GAMM|nr:glycoside hydrolase family 27 protein [Echinimonas agarilytica]MCM2679057.1 glycoside hydrolase family 27 protein [Echinimonas agarilytica]
MTFFNTKLAKTPPMGWNSWDCFSVTVTEEEVKANADFVAKHLKQYGWEYIVVDLAWFAPGAEHDNYKNFNIPQVIDDYGRLIPDVEKFPSSAGGKGFKPLAEYVHSLGLKFGIHIMRGLPMQAAEAKTPVKGTDLTADQISYDRERCPWYNSLLTLNFSQPGAQEYYNSCLEMYAEWGVDYIKADDLNAWHAVDNSDGSPTGEGSPYRIDDIEGLSRAIRNSGRDIVFSLSPGGPETTIVNHLRKNANLWRISADFWDEWGSLKTQMNRCATWAPFATEGHWPDADMLPIGDLPRGESGGQNRVSNFNSEELHTLISMWCLCRSPLMMGCNLPNTDEETIKVLSNGDVMAINQASKDNRQIIKTDDITVWRATAQDGSAEYVGIFNISESEQSGEFDVADLELTNAANAVELWGRYEANTSDSKVAYSVKPHDVVLLKIEA